jgi:hypothetical protein
VGGTGGHRGVGTYGGNYADDPFNNSGIPDIDVEDDFKNINAKNQEIVSARASRQHSIKRL